MIRTSLNVKFTLTGITKIKVGTYITRKTYPKNITENKIVKPACLKIIIKRSYEQ